MLFGGLHETINQSSSFCRQVYAQEDLYPLSLLHTCSWLLLELPHDDAYAFLEQDTPVGRTSRMVKRRLCLSPLWLRYLLVTHFCCHRDTPNTNPSDYKSHLPVLLLLQLLQDTPSTYNHHGTQTSISKLTHVPLRFALALRADQDWILWPLPLTPLV